MDSMEQLHLSSRRSRNSTSRKKLLHLSLGKFVSKITEKFVISNNNVLEWFCMKPEGIFFGFRWIVAGINLLAIYALCVILLQLLQSENIATTALCMLLHAFHIKNVCSENYLMLFIISHILALGRDKWACTEHICEVARSCWALELVLVDPVYAIYA